MKEDKKILDKVNRNSGMTVPENYFADFAEKMMQSLPEKEEPIITKPLTTWQKIRPYVYLAAMFAGIWCMMKMFHMMTVAPDISLENVPELVAEAMSKPENIDVYVPTGVVSETDVVTQLAEEYESFDEFINNFGYEFDENISYIDFSELDLESFSSSDDLNY